MTGCSATLWMKNNTLLKEVDYWIDNKDKNTIVQLLKQLTLNHTGVPDRASLVRDDNKNIDI